MKKQFKDYPLIFIFILNNDLVKINLYEFNLNQLTENGRKTSNNKWDKLIIFLHK